VRALLSEAFEYAQLIWAMRSFKCVGANIKSVGKCPINMGITICGGFN